jgi:hypothetical protein
MPKTVIKDSKSIYFVLSTELNLYIKTPVNYQLFKTYPNRIYEFSENLFLEILPEIKKADQVFLVVTTKASFTDTRILYLWLKTWQNMNVLNNSPKEFYINKNPIIEVDEAGILKALSKLKNWSDVLIYSAKPRIGVSS